MKLNPKSINAGQMFGKIDVATNDWSDGIFSSLWRKSMKGKRNEHFWLILDGPVDPFWIENLNSVLDDNKTLTLANGDRLAMKPEVRLIFEPQNVDNASPATVSRCGMVYMSSSGLDWQPLLASWFKKKELDPEHASTIKKLFETSFPRVYKYASANLHFVMKVLQVHILHTLFTLLETLLPCIQKVETDEVVSKKKISDQDKKKKAADVQEEDDALDETSESHLEDPNRIDFVQTYIFCLVWAIGGYLENDDRVKLEGYIRNKTELPLPVLQQGNDIFNYNVNPRTGHWAHWNDQLTGNIKISLKLSFPLSTSFSHFSNLQVTFLRTLIRSLMEAYWYQMLAAYGLSS